MEINSISRGDLLIKEIRCAKAVFDAKDHYVKCSIDGAILDGRCQKCVQYEHTTEGIPVINRKTEQVIT